MKDERLPTEDMWGPIATRTGRVVTDYRIDRADESRLVADGGFQLGEFLDALAGERRRYVLYYLRDEETAELDEVVEQVAAWEAGTPPDEVDDQTQKNVWIDLYHAQLPKLRDAGIIGYDSRHGSMCFRHPPDTVGQFLDYCADVESPETIG